LFQGGREGTQRDEKKFEEPLDKLPNLWYNKDVPRGNKQND
jgi:hypothetical protein